MAKLDIGRIKRVELAAGERTLVASKTEQSWTDANGEPVAGIDMALWRLTDLKYDQEPRAASESFSEAVLTVRLFDDQNAPIAAYSFLNDETSAPGSVLLQVHGETTLYPVSDELLNDLQALTPAADE